ncbi:MAG: SOS response-associated peptidase [Bacteroidetes bacterium]|nr:MAG: SOS response-associated peptidase [Bacteroidota bacterium]
MCFSVNVNLIKEELESRYGATLIDPDKYRPSYYYHAFGLPELPAICSETPERIRLLKWGLVPSWVKTIDDANAIRYKTFNARAESVEKKPSFSFSFRSRRCIIPVKGFFEWQHVGKEKIPWYIFHSGNELLSIAGLYDEWISDSTGEILSTFSMITTDANDLMAEIHNSTKRMPVILDKTAEILWLDLTTSTSAAQSLLKPCPSEILKAHIISPLVNDRTANRNTPEVIRPFINKSENLMF